MQDDIYQQHLKMQQQLETQRLQVESSLREQEMRRQTLAMQRQLAQAQQMQSSMSMQPAFHRGMMSVQGMLSGFGPGYMGGVGTMGGMTGLQMGAAGFAPQLLAGLQSTAVGGGLDTALGLLGTNFNSLLLGNLFFNPAMGGQTAAYMRAGAGTSIEQSLRQGLGFFGNPFMSASSFSARDRQLELFANTRAMSFSMREALGLGTAEGTGFDPESPMLRLMQGFEADVINRSVEVLKAEGVGANLDSKVIADFANRARKLETRLDTADKLDRGAYALSLISERNAGRLDFQDRVAERVRKTITESEQLGMDSLQLRDKLAEQGVFGLQAEKFVDQLVQIAGQGTGPEFRLDRNSALAAAGSAIAFGRTTGIGAGAAVEIFGRRLGDMDLAISGGALTKEQFNKYGPTSFDAATQLAGNVQALGGNQLAEILAYGDTEGSLQEQIAAASQKIAMDPAAFFRSRFDEEAQKKVQSVGVDKLISSIEQQFSGLGFGKEMAAMFVQQATGVSNVEAMDTVRAMDERALLRAADAMKDLTEEIRTRRHTIAYEAEKADPNFFRDATRRSVPGGRR